ncbi:MAG: type III pantothenate kinase [Comamonadaceae bacterium]|nr:MAG: type III pantothenate kinase [Comamonadaceae bacterium]
MMLLIDSGNSRIKLGIVQGQADNGMPRLVTAALDNRDMAGVQTWLCSQTEPATQAWGVNVAGLEQQQRIERLLADQGIPVRWQRAQVRTGWLRNGYVQPGQLGADRWASMVGVIARMGQPGRPFMLACFGTATTIDIVDDQGLFQGGMILPGPALMRHSLSTGTADLPLATSTSTLFPTDTHAAIATGVAAAQAGAFARQCRLALQQYGQVPAMYACGGGWHDVEAETRRLVADVLPASAGPTDVIEFLSHPVLDGLAFMASH